MGQKHLRLKGKVAIVTGAGSRGPGVGTGKAASILMAREGARVLLVDVEPRHAQETLEIIRAEGGEASVYAGDVTSAADCRGMVRAAVGRYGGLHVLFNNVGIGGSGTVADVEEDEWDRVLDVNLKSMMLTGKYAVPEMVRCGGGSVVNVSSTEALRGAITGSVAYSASKAGVIALTRTMAVTHGRDNVRVNCIAPGRINTPMVADVMTEEFRELRKREVPLGTEGTAWDVGWACVFLASDEARWITGAVLPVDGGLLATTPLAMLDRLR